jgi:Mce-associated membrane protein
VSDSGGVLPDPPPAPERGRPPWSYVFFALGLAAVSLALAVGAVATGSTLGGGGTSDEDRERALQAARDRTVALTSYDFRRLDQDFQAVLGASVPPFRDEYTSTIDQLKPAFTQAEAVATSTVVGAGLESYAPERAVAVLAVDQQIATKGAQPRTERNRLRMTLVPSDQGWVVERVERL